MFGFTHWTSEKTPKKYCLFHFEKQYFLILESTLKSTTEFFEKFIIDESQPFHIEKHIDWPGNLRKESIKRFFNQLQNQVNGVVSNEFGWLDYYVEFLQLSCFFGCQKMLVTLISYFPKFHRHLNTEDKVVYSEWFNEMVNKYPQLFFSDEVFSKSDINALVYYLCRVPLKEASFEELKFQKLTKYIVKPNKICDQIHIDAFNTINLGNVSTQFLVKQIFPLKIMSEAKIIVSIDSCKKQRKPNKGDNFYMAHQIYEIFNKYSDLLANLLIKCPILLMIMALWIALNPFSFINILMLAYMVYLPVIQKMMYFQYGPLYNATCIKEIYTWRKMGNWLMDEAYKISPIKQLFG